MPLIPYDPYEMMKRMKREMDRLRDAHSARWFPAELGGPLEIQVRETSKEVIVVCRSPGLKHAHDVEAEIRGNLLTLRRHVDASYEMTGQQMHKRERYVGRFQRTIPLPAPIDAGKQKATAGDGVVEFRWPKAALRR